MRWGNRRISSGVLTFIFILLMSIFISAATLVVLIFDIELPKIEAPQDPEKEKKRKR